MPLIQRPAPVWDALVASANSLQQQRYQEEYMRAQERIRQRNLLTTGLGAAAGAGIGLLAAPALGLAGAGTAGSIPAGTAAGEAVGLGASWVPGAAASSAGLWSAGLTGAALGANVAQGLQSGDLAGPLGMAANVVNQAVTKANERRLYGYNPTPAEKATFAQAAARAGTNMGSIYEAARRQGITVPQALQQAQQYADNQEVTQAYQIAYQRERGQIDAQLGGTPGYAQQIDHNAIAGIQDELRSVDRNYQNGNITFDEAVPMWRDLNQRLAIAKKGTMQPKGPEIGFTDPATGEQGSVPMFQATRIGSKMVVMTPDAKGAPHITTWDAGDEVKPIRVVGPDGTTKEYKGDAVTLPGGQTIVRDGYNLQKTEQTPGQKFTTDAISNLSKPNAQGDIPMLDNPEAFGKALVAGDRLEELPKLKKNIDAVAQNPNLITSANVKELIRSAQYVYGDEWKNADVGPQIAQFYAVAKAKEAAAVQAARGPVNVRSQLTGPPQGIVPRQAAKPESYKFSAAAAEAGEPTRTPQQTRQFEIIQRQNLEAGIDDPISVVSPDGAVTQIIKGSLDPTKRAQLKAQGFTIPGLED